MGRSSRTFFALLALVALSTAARPAGAVTWPASGFNPCKFNFGSGWQGKDKPHPARTNHVSIWVGDTENWNDSWQGDFMRALTNAGPLQGKTPVLYSYIIAFTGRRDRGLKDCDTGSPNLCEQGANFIRQNETRILAQYTKFAQNAARMFGTANPIIWLMEPDFFQYANGQQQGGALSYGQLGTLMGKLMDTVAQHLPNALFSLDISPWIPDPANWWNAMPVTRATFMSTSGGRTEADNTRIRNANTMQWSHVFQLTGKRIIADDGYGTGGGSIGHDGTWDNAGNINARINDGVLAITQANPRGDWDATINTLRNGVNAVPNCSATIGPAAGGSGGATGRGGAPGSGGGAPGSGAQGGAGGQPDGNPGEPIDPPSGQGGGAGDGAFAGNQGEQGGQGGYVPPDENPNEFFGVGCAAGGATRPHRSPMWLLIAGAVWLTVRRGSHFRRLDR